MNSLALNPVRLPLVLRGEILVRIALAGFLAWVGSTDPDQSLVLALCGLAALYHLYVAGRIASYRLPSATGLTLDPAGVMLRQLWRDRRIPWARIVRIDIQQARLFSGQRAGVVLTLGDAKGPVEMVAIPNVFAPGPNELLAELEQRRHR